MAKRATPPETPNLVGLDDDAAVEALSDLGSEALEVQPGDEDEEDDDEAAAAAAAAAAAEETSTEDAEAGDDPEKSGKGKPDAEGEEEEGEEEEGEVELSGLADLAKDYGVSEDEFLTSIGIEGANGETVTLADVVSSYREGGASAGERAALDEERGAFTEREKAFRLKEAEGLQGLQSTTERLLTMIEGEEKVDWATLEKDDPIEYVRQKQKAIERREALGESITRLRTAETEHAASQREEFVTFQKSEAKKAIDAMPAWRDPKVATEAMNQTLTYLKGLGYTDEQLDMLADHREIISAWRASEHVRLMAAKPRRLKKAKEATKQVPLHARKGKGQGTRARQRLRRTLERTGDDRVAAKLLEAHV